ncbi:MAG TPA: hypothetical protein G4N99_02360 [Thermoflexia bacterium]|nr:hypothetical protein [Thermoflexia bacterium]
MILRKDVLERAQADELDGLIRWALRRRVAGASPSPQVWERIRARAERPKPWALVDLIASGYRMATIPLSKIDAFLSVQYTAFKWPQPKNEWVEWRYDPWLTRLLEQYSSMLKLAC